MPTTAQFYDEGGRPVELGQRLGRGGEGEVFPLVGQSDRVAKILYGSRRTKNKYDKVRAMVARPPAGAYESVDGYPVLTWPRTLLYNSETRRNADTFAGYTMTHVQRRDFIPLFEITSNTRRGTLGGSPVTWDSLVLLSLRLCHVVRTLHKFGYAIGDLNDRNLLVSRRFTPLIMDTDSFQVPKSFGGHFPSIVGDQMYWAPELLDVDLATHTGDRSMGDRFALGVLLFQVFLNGNRPYQSRGSRVDALESLAAKTREGHFPWASPQRGVLEPPAAAPEYQSLPASIRRRLEQCFVDGHRKPKKRPSADEWYDALNRVHQTGYQTCPQESRHVFGADLRSCPWCADPNNPFTPAKRASPRPPSKETMRRAPPPPSRKHPKPPLVAVRAAATRRRTASPRPVVLAVGASPKGRIHLAKRPRRPPSRDAATAGVQRVLIHWAVRALWMTALALLFLAPLLVLRSMPLGAEKMAMTTSVTVSALFGLGVSLSWRFARSTRARAYTAATAFIIAGATVFFLAGTGHWEWLDYATGGVSFAMGALTFAALEWRSPAAFRPRPQGFVHGFVGLAPAFLPVGALWVWLRF